MMRSQTSAEGRSRPFALLAGSSIVLGAGITLGAFLVDARAQSTEARGAAAVAGQALPVTVTTADAQAGYAIAESYAGRVTARRTSTLGFERSGRLIEVLVDDGDAVEAGQALARLNIDPLVVERRRLVAQLAAAGASVEEIGAQLTLAERTRERRAELLARQHVSEQTYDDIAFEQQAATARQVAAQAGLSEVRAAIAAVDLDIELSTIRAPFDGTILARDADEGTVVQAGQSILELIEDAVLEVRVGVPPERARDLRIGTEFDVTIDGRPHRARLEDILPRVDAATRTVPLILMLLDPEGVRSGALARVAVMTEVTGRGFWLPLSALTEGRRGLWAAYALVPADTADTYRVERRDVEVLHAETGRAYVRGALRPGDRIVAAGVQRIVPGQTVTPQ